MGRVGKEYYRAHLGRGVTALTTIGARYNAEHSSAQAQLEASVPSSTISPAQPSSARRVTPTQTHARSLRVLLESLDDVLRSRADLVRRAVRLAESEDIKPRILKAAATIEQWVDVQPSMFEDVLEDELAKYDKFRSDLEGSEQKQSELLNSIKVQFFIIVCLIRYLA